MILIEDTDEHALRVVYRTGWSVTPDEEQAVARIIASVRADGDEAVVALTQRFDWEQAHVGALARSIPDLAMARELVPVEIAQAIDLAANRVERFHRAQHRENIVYTEDDGTHYEFRYEPLEAVAVYVPGGSAPLPSTVVMGTIPARVAGVPRIVVLTPPQRDGTIHPAILYAAARCGVHELYAAGGAQAIAAAAYGTSVLQPVAGIVGPGNVWVTEAKRQVFGTCAIDGLAGPSEVLVVADSSAHTEFIVAELLAQAEHDPRARVAVVSESRDLLDACMRALAAIDIAALPRASIITQVIAHQCYFIHAQNRAGLFSVISRFAPEHLSLMVADVQTYLPHVRHAGAIFAGDQTPVACGDYVAGTNHTLPTSGAARFSSGLSLAHFLRTSTLVWNTEQRMRHDAPIIDAFARFEGLYEHAKSARMRAPS